MEKEDMLLRKRLIELSDISYRKSVITFSDFLNLHELNILHTTPKTELAVPYSVFGGYTYSERQMAAFLPDAFSLYMDNSEIEALFPVCILKITPVHLKYAENLGHRDYLGALLNLGIDRSKLGDILVQEYFAYVFVNESLANYIVDSLVKVKHTIVLTEKVETANFQYAPKYESVKGTLASVRLDSLLALAYNSSRSKSTGLIEGAKVYVNGKLITTNAYHIKDGDIVSVRGVGRFQFCRVISETKKGRYYVELNKYI